MINFTIDIAPRTKKNSQQIFYKKIKGKKVPFISCSELYKQYEKDCEPFLPKVDSINYPINLKCVYYMPTRRKVDLNNLLEATTDMLVYYKVLEDDNSLIVCSHDGSRVYYDKESPRTEIEITRIKT